MIDDFLPTLRLDVTAGRPPVMVDATEATDPRNIYTFFRRTGNWRSFLRSLAVATAWQSSCARMAYRTTLSCSIWVAVFATMKRRRIRIKPFTLEENIHDFPQSKTSPASGARPRR